MDFNKKRKAEESPQIIQDKKLTLTPEDARKLVEPLSLEQLSQIVQNAAVSHSDVLDSVRSISDLDMTRRKLFVRGLGWDTTTEKLTSLFSTYGDLDEAIVILDKVTGKSKGFGFVTFKHVDGALLALKEPSKKIDGRMSVTQLASSGNNGSGSDPSNPNVDASSRKIYVANVPQDMQAERLLSHFSKYGEIEEGPLGFDKLTGKSRGFTLFVYKTEQAARDSLVDPMKVVDGHQLVCKLAIKGEKGKTGGPGGVQGPNVVDSAANGPPFNGPMSSHYGPPAGISSYGMFAGGIPGPRPMGQNPHGINASSVSGSYETGVGGNYSVSPYAGNIGGGLGLVPVYNRVMDNATSMPTSAGYHENGPYSGLYQTQHNPAPSALQVPRVPPGAMYRGPSPYY